ncbi:MAG: hypothetical protein FJ279_13670, partial [Planctomycetes bacterium]|nr:hypothetical protein [Planctomycetota bacterium]
LIMNPAFAEKDEQGGVRGWRLPSRTTRGELAPGAEQWRLGNAADYGLASQPLDIPVKPGDVYTVFAVARGDEKTRAGIAVVQEMEDGRPDDLYPFWNKPVTRTWQLYSGCIVVDKGARRFQRVGLYRSNREGHVEYAYVQMFPGAMRRAGILEMADSVPPDERGLGAAWPTPHLPCYRPLAGGPLRALIFVGAFQRDVVELAQRLDLDYDFCYCPTFRPSGKVEHVFAWDAARVLTRLEAGYYDVFLLAGRPSHSDVVDALARWVQAGKGLVFVEFATANRPSDEAAFKQISQLLPKPVAYSEAAYSWLSGLPLPLLNPSPITRVGQGEAGKGRVVRIQWSQPVAGLAPSAGPTPGGTEMTYAALARAMLWAGRRELPCELARVEFRGDQVVVSTNAASDGRREFRLMWDTEIGQAPESARRAVELKTGAAAEVTFDAPRELSVRRGLQLARVQVTNASGAVEAFAAAGRVIEPPVRIQKVTAPELVAPEAAIPVAIGLSRAAGARHSLSVELVDAFDRVVSRSVRELAADEAEIKAELAAHCPLSVYHEIRASLLSEGRLMDEATAPLWLPQVARGHTDDFRLCAGYAAMPFTVPAHLRDCGIEFLRQQGVWGMTVSECVIQRGMAGWGGTVAGIGMSYNGSEHVRKPCFSDPALRRELATKTAEKVADKAKWGWVGYNMNDEVHLHQHASVEVCTCSLCADGFREWAKSAYGTLQQANASWGASYADFGQVTPPLLADLKGQSNPARWVDFRLFQEEVWATAYADTARAVKAKCPEARLSFTNPYKFDALSGVNFWLWTPHEDILLKYFHPHVADRYRSWSRAPMVAWFGYRLTAAESGRFPWWFAFNGGVMPIWWNALDPWAYSGKDSFTPWYLCDPLWRPTERSQKVTEAANELHAGIGRLLRAARPAQAKVAVLHSQPSMHVQYALAALPKGKPAADGYNQWQDSHTAWTSALKRNAVGYDYVVPEQVEAGKLAAYEALILPAAIALSDKTLSAVRQFAGKGGQVLADAPPGAYTDHGSPRAQANPLADLFQAADRAACLGRPASDKSDPSDLQAVIERLGLRPETAWEAAGTVPREAEIYAFELDEGRYVGLVRNVGEKAANQPPITLTLPKALHAYDVRKGKYLGHVSRVTQALAPGEAALLALLPYRVTGLEAVVASPSSAQDAVLRLSIASTAKPTTHVLHLDLTDPSGAVRPCYSLNIVAPEGRADARIPFALSDPLGPWTARARDVATGAEAAVLLVR